MRYIYCIHCGKIITEGSEVVRRRGFTGNYCSWKCAAIESNFFQMEKLTDELTKKDKECNSVN